ncbi:neutral alpha-glucosidase AB isoform X3 [Folsomia candida]|uniref:Glucosidase II subunit alpha n=1 Tax=Folsomia candida TaxID=158441 RepID=A0A226ERG3_FOLCA|nr:neutral alpha-glucosidase AB isoform X3 [Folsomia candida]OXA60099.1 Neutral alpha-glucosidase AB [Folsomia candida]
MMKDFGPTVLIFLCVFNTICDTVDKSKFKICDQSGFCKRQRHIADGSSNFDVNLKSGRTFKDYAVFDIVNKDNGHKFLLEVHTYMDGTFRVLMNEESPLHPRYQVEHALLPDLKKASMEFESVGNGESWTLAHTGMRDKFYVQIFASPMKLDFYSGGKKVAVFNGRNSLKYEHLRNKPDVNDEPKEDGGEETPQEPSMWEEQFSSHSDSKPRGPESIGVDIDFPLTQNLYGIPEHADDFRLKDTSGREPFRLYNLDVFEYELDSPMTLYGSIPYMMAHSPERTVGVLWVNAAETWIDVKTGGSGIVDSIVNLVGGSEDKEGRTRWMSESGIIDAFFFLGPSPLDVFKQYAKVTGVTPLPQMWAIGSHQCRWNYNDEEDVRGVDANFDSHDIPYDSIWLDIEHTDGKKYFTWDSHKFPHPVEMIQNISSKGRKMVTIIDPHIKRDGGYFLHEDALANDLYVKDKNGKVYEGWCWPGSSSYLDFFDPKVREYWASRFALDKYPSTLDLYTWNDMNEPSVFNGPEVTMPKDMMHYGGWEHRQVHNMYGLMQVMSTFEGQLQRSENQLRPFILTRAHFIGSQRYSAVWTGDNMANWEHLKASIPMCLSLSISGMSHCGADIGGFFQNPDAELMLRWYQAAAFQPFMRNHAHIETKRREPWLFGDRTTALIRSAVRRRYALLPYWYTLFYENEQTGVAPMRPLWAHYPTDAKTFGIQDAHLIGESLLVHPVTDKGATSINVYLPHGVWYDFYNYIKYEGGTHTLTVNDDTIPVFQRAGSIIPTKQRIRRASSLMKDDPYTLFVAIDEKGEAHGTLYIDDQQTFEYRTGSYLKVDLTYKNNKLSSKVVHSGPSFNSKEWIERVVILGANKKARDVKAVSKSVGSVALESEGEHPLVIRKPAVLVNEDWEIDLHF